ncbi:MAG: hypothetical protein BM556_14810 [Bacteriovorax sp. MedPE-SWde]|nr:MAG: hypothetical protein BM556_14810 [Bacteriovorax sp. MedPE-SWde]
MKKLIIAALLLLSFETRAIVGLVTGNPGMALAGLTVGTSWYTTAYICDKFFDTDCFFVDGIEEALAVSLLGLIVLDNNSEQLVFKEITIESENLAQLNLTKLEIESYNENLEELNLVLNEVSFEMTSDSKIEDAKELWDDLGSFLPTETLSAAKKIASKLKR